MYALLPQVFGYNKNIENYENQIIKYNVTVYCHNIEWTTEKKVTTFVIALIAALFITITGILYGTGVISYATANPLFLLGDLVLLGDVVIVIQCLNARLAFIDQVGDEIKKDAIQSNEFDLMCENGPKKLYTYESCVYEIGPNKRQVIVYRKYDTSFSIHYFQTQELLNASKKYYYSMRSLIELEKPARTLQSVPK